MVMVHICCLHIAMKTISVSCSLMLFCGEKKRHEEGHENIFIILYGYGRRLVKKGWTTYQMVNIKRWRLLGAIVYRRRRKQRRKRPVRMDISENEERPRKKKFKRKDCWQWLKLVLERNKAYKQHLYYMLYSEKPEENMWQNLL